MKEAITWQKQKQKMCISVFISQALFILSIDTVFLLNNTKDVCDTFNTFFVNVTNDIGKDVIFDGNSHPSTMYIEN